MANIAVFTMAYNETVFLPRWVNYYARQVGMEHLYVIDHGSTDGSTEKLRCSVVKIPRSPYDPELQTESNNKYQHFLLKWYDVVIYADADEFLVPDPALYSSLRDYCERMQSDTVRAFGYNVFHHYQDEPPINLSEPILGQRKYWRFMYSMCKPMVTRKPINWQPGGHDTRDPSHFDRNLFNLHMKEMDYDLAREKMRHTRTMAWSKNALDRRLGTHARREDSVYERVLADVLKGFQRNVVDSTYKIFDDKGSAIGPLTPIPERFHNLV